MLQSIIIIFDSCLFFFVAVISFYETDSVFLSILGCLLVCLDVAAANESIKATTKTTCNDESDDQEKQDAELAVDCASQSSAESVSNALNKAEIEGRVVWQHQSNSSPDLSLNRINQSQGFSRSEGILGWRPLSEWSPSARRLLVNFSQLVSQVRFVSSHFFFSEIFLLSLNRGSTLKMELNLDHFA